MVRSSVGVSIWILLLVLACGDDAPMDAKVVQSRYHARLMECGLGQDGAVSVGAGLTPEQLCRLDCEATLGCDELRTNICSQSSTAVSGCYVKCLERHGFTCGEGTRLSSSQLCDDIAHCDDLSDELDCEGLKNGRFFCSKGGVTVDERRVCDGTTDCDNGRDEQQCDTLVVDCNDGVLPVSRQCDGVSDCADHSDEEDCGWGQFECAEGGSVHGHLRCDGQPDCPDESDEKGCAQLACGTD